MQPPSQSHTRAAENTETPRRDPWWFPLGLCAIGIAGAWVRFNGLTASELWLDENCTFYWVHHFFDWPARGPNPWDEPAHLPYFFLLHLWTRITGETAWGLRSFSALTGSATVPFLGLVASRIAGRRVGLLTSLLAAFHPLHGHYSQEARVYALWMLLATVTLLAIHTASIRGGALRWSGYAAAALALIMTHYYALLWLPSTAAWCLVTKDRKRFLGSWLVTHAVLGLLLIPIAYYLMLPAVHSGPKGWLTDTWLQTPPLLAIPKSLWAMMPAGGYPAYLGPLGRSGDGIEELFGGFAADLVRWLPAGMIAGSWMILLVVAAARRCSAPGWPSGGERGSWAFPLPSLSTHARVLGAASISILVFLFAAFAGSLVTGGGYVVGRYDVAAWPAAVLATVLWVQGTCEATIRRTVMRQAAVGAAVGIMACCGGMTIYGTRRAVRPGDTPRRAALLASYVGDQDLLVSMGLYRWFLLYEWQRQGVHAEVVSFPPWHDRQLCWEDARAELSHRTRLASEANMLATRIVEEIERGRAVWLLHHGSGEGPRWQADQYFFSALRERGLNLAPIDDWLGLLRVSNR